VVFWTAGGFCRTAGWGAGLVGGRLAGGWLGERGGGKDPRREEKGNSTRDDYATDSP